MFTALEAKHVVQTLFGLDGSINSLPGEYDANFHVKAHDGKEFLLKISHFNAEKAIVDMQNEALHWLQAANASFDSPYLQRTLSGDWVGHWSQPHACFVRLFSYVPGTLFAEARYHSPQLLESLGTQLGQLTLALHQFQHAAAKRTLKWDLKQAHWIEEQLHVVENAEGQACIQYFLARFKSEIAPTLSQLRHSVIHGDVNDYNTLVMGSVLGNERVSGFIDFGDLIETATICELAIAATYAMLNKADPLLAAAQVVKGYHAVFPLQEKEIAILFDLICMRLCTSVVNSAIRKKENPDPYLTVSEEQAWELLKKLRAIHPRLAHYIFRDACQWHPCPQTIPLVNWLKAHSESIGSLFQFDLRTTPKTILDLSPRGIQMHELAEALHHVRKSGVDLVIGQYNETRIDFSYDESQTIHLGLDLFMAAGIAVYAPLDGMVHSVTHDNDGGSAVILKHVITDANITFYTLYDDLNRHSLSHLSAGNVIAKGDVIGAIDDFHIKVGMPSHLHFQIISDPLDNNENFPRIAQANHKSVWLSLSPDPNLITRIPANEFPSKPWQKSDIQRAREKHISNNVGLSYQQPLQIIRGIGQYLFDEDGRKYLDCVNNVCHVGHCHPKVVAAGQKQMALLNTNTRYLHEHLPRYAERLLAHFPASLEVCFFVCSGSEANELALRLARAYTGLTDVLVMDHGYHGNTTMLVNISPYKFNGAGGEGKPDFVHILPMPDPLRDKEKLEHLSIPRNIAAFICESLPSCGGQVVLPDHYLQQVYKAVREAGGVCIADEVQVGLGRVGTHFWGFETQAVIPDIVTLGKPLGNGHPIGAVITTRKIADSFCNGMEYFNTFGGNPVSCAIGISVLDVLEEENLQTHALEVGPYLKQKLHHLKEKHACIGDVRGLGLFLGIEFVTNQQRLTPAKHYAAFVVNQMKERGILLSTDGPFQNVIKIKPPLVFTKENSDFLVKNLDEVLSQYLT